MIFIEIIALIFLSKKNGALALQKGLKPSLWKLYTILAWICGEFAGALIGLLMFGETNFLDFAKMPPALILQISAVGLFTAFGGYLLIRYILENKPDNNSIEEEIKQIGVDDLRPPKNNTN